MRNKFEIFMVLCLLFSSFVLARRFAALTSAQPSDHDAQKPCIVIDPGHGASDPGKVSADGLLEKDLNLSIALSLAPLLENKGFRVILTRSEDISLAGENATNVKREDMKRRLEIIQEADPFLTVSIHQNSFSDPNVSGPQVFYFASATESRTAAELLQEQLNTTLKPRADRFAKSNSDYFLLKKTPTPTVIVECGFLSNPQEAGLLADTLYQDKIVRAIYLGICEYYAALHDLSPIPQS